MLDFLQAAVALPAERHRLGRHGRRQDDAAEHAVGLHLRHERIVTIEDAAELMLRQRHVVRLETRPPNIEGKGSVRQRELVVNALRMRPDRIIVGEVRGEEALDMLQAMNTGHDGSLTTIHANSPRDALYRLDTMVAMANLNIPEKAIRQQIASAIEAGRADRAHVRRHAQGDGDHARSPAWKRDVITMQDIFVFEKIGVTDKGKVTGRFRATGIRPKCTERLAASGVHLPAEMFEHVEDGGVGRMHDAGLLLIFALVFAVIFGSYWMLVVRPEDQEERALRKRLKVRERDRAWTGHRQGAGDG